MESKSEAKKSESVTIYATRFSIKSVNSNMQTGSDFRQLASIIQTVNWGKSHVVYSSLK